MSKVLLLAKTTDWCSKAVEQARDWFTDIVVCQGENNDPFPKEALDWQGDIIISYLSPWIVPADVLARAKEFAINFHPAPPEYPGIGCYNFALYDGVKEYGATCHHMAARVDTGSIVAVKKFPVTDDETVLSLKNKTMDSMFELYLEVMSEYQRSGKLPESELAWTRKPYTRRELNALCRVTPEMDIAEISRRVRATTFPGAPGAYVDLGGLKFAYTGEAK